jgi:two-component system NtrC family sensor kinase
MAPNDLTLNLTSDTGGASRRNTLRHHLLALTLLPLLGVLPLLGLILLLWGNNAIDRLLIGKVRSDLAVAQGYFERVQAEVGSGTAAVAGSHRLLGSLARPKDLSSLLERQRQRLRFDFLRLLPPDAVEQGSGPHAEVTLASQQELARLGPELAERARIRLLPTQNAAQTAREVEDRALLLTALAEVQDDQGRRLGWLQGGVMLNRNLGFIDHINEIVYPEGSLPFGSQGTATLFLDDVRITTNVRLFADPGQVTEGEQRAVGTRVSQEVREAVLGRGETWLDRAFVVKDWYVSAYLPLSDAAGQRVGMLYVGYLEEPFAWIKYAVLAGIGVVFFAVMILAAIWSLRAAGQIYRPLERMTATLQRVERGDLTARAGPIGSRRTPQEIARLAATLDHLLDVIDDKTRALQRWGEELDLRVAERTRELEASHERLQSTQQQLVRSEKLAAIGQLTASIAHEVNNPIAVIQGNLDLLRLLLGEAARPAAAELRLIDEQIERMRLIVTQLLQFARPTEFAGYVEPLHPRDVLTASLVLVNHLLVQQGIRVERQDGASRTVTLNRQELQQVLINLLVNAAQAMPAGGRLLLRSRDVGEQEVVIEVADSGPGLDAAQREHLFEPFFTTKREGNGLGLWISRSLLERYGGELEACPQADALTGGACFQIRLQASPLPPRLPVNPAEA